MTDLAQRLARFRELRPGPAAQPRQAFPPPLVDLPGAPRARGLRGDAAAGRAEHLAAAIGGTVDHRMGGAVVRVRSTSLLPLAAHRLAALPYPVDPDGPVVCLDTETTGLGTAAGTVAFLVGLGRWDADHFVVEQLLLPDHPDEPAFLDALAGAIGPDAWLVTYNGRAFDWPLLVTRFRLHRLPAPAHAGHLDLLPVARQLWRHRLGDARLSSVESGVAGVHRAQDLPGALIPERYLGYLRTGDPRPLRAVVAHNRQDIVSLARLLVELADGLADPRARRLRPAGDLAGLARAFARRRRFDEALACCSAARERCRDATLQDRLCSDEARILRMAGRHDDSASAWRALAERGGPLAASAWLQLAKHHEHRRHDPVSALDATERAATLAARARLVGAALPDVERDLAKRRIRLRRRIERRRLRRSPSSGGAPPGSPGPAGRPAHAPRS